MTMNIFYVYLKLNVITPTSVKIIFFSEYLNIKIKQKMILSNFFPPTKFPEYMSEINIEILNFHTYSRQSNCPLFRIMLSKNNS